jgi:DtxR family transcriptional regulator, Mn-dependent transcriptional regulator
MPQEQIEEYLEAIYDIAGKDGKAKTTEIAERLKNAPASVTEVLQRMDRDGLVKYEPYQGASLTKKGEHIVTRIKRKHRLLEVFLEKVLHLPKEHIHDQACKMEHVINDETEQALCKTLGVPTECPHGSPIPPCNIDVKSCNECLSEDNPIKEKRKQKLISITTLKPGQKGKVEFIRGGRNVVQRLCDLGLTNGTCISLVREAPLKGPVEICVRGCNVVIGRGIADKIFIQAEGT